MLFNSLQFFFFFPIVTVIYFILPQRLRWQLLLAASCFFYMAFIPAYIAVLFLTIAIDYAAAIFIERSRGRTRKAYLILSIVSTCLVLGVFKYFNFINDNLRALAVFLHWNYPVETLRIILPIGLSFHTFQSLSYVIEVYRGNQQAERRFGIYALYVMFYPQLVAGPIERPQHLLPQFDERHEFEYRRVSDGLKLMAWGLFKKLVLADRLALFVNTVYGRPHDYPGISLILATVFFAFQIYCDFSGYSDVAIGAAQVMGFRLRDNFNRPYFARSIPEFWKRWHISLSTWFRDYVYIPLGGKRVSQARWRVNILLTFVISGIWHGANWTFIIWGGLHGFYYLVSAQTKFLRSRLVQIFGLSCRPRLHAGLQAGLTFTLVCFAWIFFRAAGIREAAYIITHLTSGVAEFCLKVSANLFSPSAGKHLFDDLLLKQEKADLVVAVAGIIFLECVHMLQRHGSIRQMLADKPAWLRWALYYSFILGIVVLGKFDNRQFIYFQF